MFDILHHFKDEDTNLTVQPQEMAEGLKFRIERVEGFVLYAKRRISHDAAHFSVVL